MKNIKRVTTLLLAVVMLLAMSIPAFAAAGDTGFSDVAADAWYADAVEYVRDNGLMSGTSATTFSPDESTSRAMLAAILYRAAGSPAVSASAAFSDVAADTYYADAVSWASANGIVSGYGNGQFGGDNPVTREQIVTILWRYAGSPVAGTNVDFADERSISSFAAQAVDWAQEHGIINGKSGNRFDPQGTATRAEVAVILRNFMMLEQSGSQTPDKGGNTLVVYFSATGSTEKVANTIAETLDADLFELVPTNPYTADDLDWTMDSSRVNAEHDNPAQRVVELTATTVDNWDSYDTVFIGYPIWWGIAAWPVDSFIAANDFTGKTVIPFCTSASSGIGQSGELLAGQAGTGNWLEGQRFSSGASEAVVREWITGLNLHTAAPTEQASRALVVYFSMPETTDPNNMTTEEANSTVVIGGKVLGNTQYMAQVIQEHTGADLFRIEPVTPYPAEHSTLVDLASEEQDNNARPAIQGHIDNLRDYDTVFIGYPIWWSDMPMILYSFFDTYDFTGKTIIPFSTHGGSSFAGTPAVIQRLEPGATLLDGLTISRNNIQDAEPEIIGWLDGLDL